MKLSALDIKLLRFIKFNGMAPSRELAQKLRISPNTVDYKLKKFEEENVITGYKYRVNYKNLGFSKMAWIFLIANYRRGIELEKMVEMLSFYPNIHTIMLLTGEYDIVLKTYAKDMHEIADLTFKIKSQLKGTVRSVNTVFAIKTYKLNQIPVKDCTEKIKIDSSEINILKYLLENPKVRIKDIAADMKIHRNTASAKLKRLREKGIIIKRTPLINPEYYYELGIAFNTLVFIDAETGCLEELARELVKCELVHELFATSTDHDMLAIVRTRDITDLSNFHKMLYSNPVYKKLVYDAKSLCVLDMLKDKADRPVCLTAV